MLGDEPKVSNEAGHVLQPKVMTASELEELKKEAQVKSFESAQSITVFNVYLSHYDQTPVL